MDNSEDDIKKLKDRISLLENENRLLKERLAEAGISYSDIIDEDQDKMDELYDPNQGARIREIKATNENAYAFFMMFCRGRKDVYDLRYDNPKSGKRGYYTQCDNFWKQGCQPYHIIAYECSQKGRKKGADEKREYRPDRDACFGKEHSRSYSCKDTGHGLY